MSVDALEAAPRGLRQQTIARHVLESLLNAETGVCSREQMRFDANVICGWKKNPSGNQSGTVRLADFLRELERAGIVSRVDDVVVLLSSRAAQRLLNRVNFDVPERAGRPRGWLGGMIAGTGRWLEQDRRRRARTE